MSASYETQAILLDRVPYRDADLVVTLLTRDHGLVAALARGARGSRRRFSGSLDLFVIVQARLKPHAGGGLAALSEAEAVGMFPGVMESLDRLEAGAGLLVLSRDLLRDAPAGEAAFRAVVAALARLEALPPEAAHLAVLDACLALLADLGAGSDPDTCLRCGAALAGVARVAPDGGLACPSCAPAGLPVPEAVRAAASALVRGGDLPPVAPPRGETLAVVTALVSGVLGRPWKLAAMPSSEL